MCRRLHCFACVIVPAASPIAMCNVRDCHCVSTFVPQVRGVSVDSVVSSPGFALTVSGPDRVLTVSCMRFLDVL